jgi:hypothetical protein
MKAGGGRPAETAKTAQKLAGFPLAGISASLLIVNIEPLAWECMTSSKHLDQIVDLLNSLSTRELLLGL